MENSITGLNPTNQITMLWGKNKQIAFFDKLKKAPYEHYAQIHAKNEKQDGSDWKLNSLIEIRIQDQNVRSNKKRLNNDQSGSQNVVVSFNIEPEMLQFLLTRVNIGVQNYSWSATKIFGDPDEHGYSFAAQCSISRSPVDKQGNVMTKAWLFKVENGRGIRVPNDNKGFYMKGGSFRVVDSATMNLSDYEMFQVLTRVDSYIKAWEITTAQDLIPKGRSLVDREKYASRNNASDSTQSSIPSYASSAASQQSQFVRSSQYAQRSDTSQNTYGSQAGRSNVGSGTANSSYYAKSSYHTSSPSQQSQQAKEEQAGHSLPNAYQPYTGDQRENIWGM